jgi:FliI/YscN family ATPase
MSKLATRFDEQLKTFNPWGIRGSVTQVIGLSAAISDFPAPLGALCKIWYDKERSIPAEVVGFRGDETLVLAYGDMTGIRRGNQVDLVQSQIQVRVGPALLGRVINSQGRFIDDKPPAALPHRMPLYAPPIPPLSRPRIHKTLETGVKVIDGFLTCGIGQRLGVFAGSGVGKSTLLGQLAKMSKADINVLVLVGERGREVREFLERDLGPEGLRRSVVVVATGEESSLQRLHAAHSGTAVAEYFRDQGKNVLLMMDSVTRYALAQREIGLASGEPPATRGYPPSVFAKLPKLLERSGCHSKGTITAIYTVLVEGDDTNEPISDTVRGVLDGHIVLSRKTANKGHFPAVDVLSSISRTMNDIVTPEQKAATSAMRELMAAYRDAEDLISVGAYQPGSNPIVDQAIQLRDPINKFLQQKPEEFVSYQDSLQGLQRLLQLKQLGSKQVPGQNGSAAPTQ